MSNTIQGYKITANRTPYRRAGLDLRAAVTLPAAELDDKRLATLEADPVVHIEKIDLPADQTVTTGAESVKLPTKKAELQEWLTERGLEYSDEDTVAQLTEQAQAFQADPAKGAE